MGYLGKLLFVGDFFQLPPVQKFGQNNDLFGEKLYAFESDAWQSFSPLVIELTEMKRTSDAEFTHILHKVRVGQCDQEVSNYMLRLSNTQMKEENPTFLFGRNAEVNMTNKNKLEAVEADEHLLFATFEEHHGKIHEKRLSSWKNILPVEEQLLLKVGVPVLFTINKWGKYANGERGIINRIEEDYIIVEKGEIFVRVERHDFDLLEMQSNDKGKVTSTKVATLSQFPLKLAYAVTIHKSQGMSIDNLVCNVNNIFAPSQFYVAISRAIDPKNLRLDFGRGDLSNYLQRVIKVDMRVVDYYTKLGESYVTNEELPF
jgi:ATP-dependent exoDNAse (exonuclease V) alpha subunit